jgi:hypothetical protein
MARTSLGLVERRVVRGALERLRGHLESGERVTHLAVAEYSGETGLLAVSDRRLLLLKRDQQKYQTFPYSEVTAAEVTGRRLGRASLLLVTMRGDIVAKAHRADALERVQQYVRERVWNMDSSGRSDEPRAQETTVSPPNLA